MTAPLAGRTGRYEALDSLRGICALCVAMFHFALASTGDPWAFARGSWMFVDFFFVLSGFVIAGSYGDRLAAGFRASDFMLLRFGRIYPLHLAVLLAIAAKEVLALVLSQRGIMQREAFSGVTSLDALAGSLGLVHIFGFWPRLVWNGPSWSIADEMWAYAVFMLVCTFVPRRFVAVMVGLALCAAGWMVLGGEPWLNRTYSGSLLRCLFGFGLGVGAWWLVKLRPQLALPRIWGEAAEWIAVIGCVLFVSWAHGAATLLAPPLFMLAVLVMAQEAGTVSAMLRTAPMRWLGRLSYSIYMIHAFLLTGMGDVAGVLQRRIGQPLMTRCPARPDLDCFVMDGAARFIVPALFLALLLAGSWLAWRFIEEPGRIWSRKLVARRAESLALTGAGT